MFTRPLRSLTVAATTLAALAGGLVLATGPSIQVASAAPIAPSSLLPTSQTDLLKANYAVPSGAVFVSTTGSDSNPGTQSQPYRTLGYAFNKLASGGGTIVMRGGTYREGASGYTTGGTNYVIRPKNVTVQSYPGELVWMDGAEVVSNWTKVSSTDYKVSWSTPSYCGGGYYSRVYSSQTTTGPCSYSDAIGGSSSLGDPQMVFVDGTQVREVASASSLTSNSFYYDWAARVVHLGFNPSGKTVEVSKYPQALALFSPTNVTVRGIGFRHYASNQYLNATSSAVLVNSGSNVTFERVVMTENAGSGLQVWQSTNLTVRRSILSANGANGMNVAGSGLKRMTDSTARDDLVVEYSRFDRNNTDSYSTNCTYSCNSAGLKMAYVVGVKIRYDTFLYNKGQRASGVWCDLHCIDGNIYGNRVVGNARHGIIYEVSEKGVIASNLLTDNGWDSDAGGGGSAILAGSATTRIYNNTLVNNKVGISVYDDDRSQGVSSGYSTGNLGPNSVSDQVVNNIVVTDKSGSRALLGFTGGTSKVSGNTTASQVLSKVDYNSYAKPQDTVYFALWRPRSNQSIVVCASVSALQAQGGSSFESHGMLTLGGGSATYLTSPSSGDYSVKAGSAADNSGAALPSDIADLLGVSSGVAVDRGVLTLGG